MVKELNNLRRLKHNHWMKICEFIQLFVPPIYYNVKNKLMPPKQSVAHPLLQLDERGDKLIIIGNGPSLNKSLELYGETIQHTDCLMVNHSAGTVVYDYIHPKYYLLVDPAWINPDKSIHREAIRKTIEAIINKTTWPMKIIMPKCAKGCYAIERFKENSNIEMLFYEDGWMTPKEMSKYEAWDKNYISPPAQTVLNTAVWLSIYWGYKETYIVGADTSFLADLRVDQETNILYTEDTHFYSNKDVYKDSYDSIKNRRPIGTKLHEELFSIGTALKDYWDMKEYADWKGVKVYNASEYSWIDAFERKKLI